MHMHRAAMPCSLALQAPCEHVPPTIWVAPGGMSDRRIRLGRPNRARVGLRPPPCADPLAAEPFGGRRQAVRGVDAQHDLAPRTHVAIGLRLAVCRHLVAAHIMRRHARRSRRRGHALHRLVRRSEFGVGPRRRLVAVTILSMPSGRP